MKHLVVVLVFLSFAKISFAQTGAIRGKISDGADNKPVTAATVSLLKQLDSSVVSKTISSAEGEFTFTNLLADSLIVKIEALNYQEYISFVNVKDTLRNLAAISLMRQNKDLTNVTVVAKAPPIIVKGDTAQFSASQYKVNPDATTEDLIKKMPGITVAKDGTVTAQGETVRKVTIDGKDFFGDDASAALKNLPAEVIDKIQVFDRLSDQSRLTGFDDGNSTKAINVVTKSGLKNGRFGRIYAGGGTDDRYTAGGNASFFKGDRRISVVGNFNNINLQNFASQDLLGLTSSNNRGGQGQGGGGGGGGRPGGGGGDFNVGQANGISKTNAVGVNFSNVYNKKVTLAGSYFYNQSNNANRSVVTTETFLGSDTSQFSRQTSNTNTNNTNQRINLRLEYNIDSNNSIFIIPNISFQTNKSNSISDLQSFEGAPRVGTFYDSVLRSFNRNTSDRDGYNIRNSILYRHGFQKKGRSISFGLNTNFTKNNSESIADADLRFYNDINIKDSSLNQFYDNVSTGYNIGGTIAYTEPLSQKAQLQFDYNPSVQKNKADQQTFSFDGQKYSMFDSAVSNKFDNTITTNNTGITYRFNKNRDAGFSIGVSYQNARLESDRIFPTTSRVDQNFNAILPNFIYRSKLSATSNIRIFYRASTNFPSVNQLQDVINFNNPLRLSTGNPELKQSYTQFVATRYSYTNSKTGKSFFANLFLQTANDFITNGTFIARQSDSIIQNKTTLQQGSQLSKPVNLDGYRSARAFLTYSMPLKFIKTTLNLNAGLNYTRLPGLINTTNILTNNYVYNTGLVLASNINEFVDFNLSYAANFNNTSSSNNADNNFINQAVGAQVNLLSKKGWFIQNDVSYQTNSGLSEGFNQKYGLWNAAVGRKFLKNQVGELKLSVFDLLKQNRSINRSVDASGIVDSQSEVLQQYFMLTFTYNLKNFGTAKASRQNSEDANRPMMGRPGGMF